jgi:hypothetical protein
VLLSVISVEAIREKAMEIPRAADGEKVTDFDLVELATEHGPHSAGEQGTVVLRGGCDALVDFAWGHKGRHHSASHLALVPYGHLKVVQHRDFPGVPGDAAR